MQTLLLILTFLVPDVENKPSPSQGNCCPLLFRVNICDQAWSGPGTPSPFANLGDVDMDGDIDLHDWAIIEPLTADCQACVEFCGC